MTTFCGDSNKPWGFTEAGNFLTIWVTINFSRKTPFHGSREKSPVEQLIHCSMALVREE
jgi:hypothetical protein